MDPFADLLPDDVLERSLVHLLAVRHQFKPNDFVAYRNFRPDWRYHLVSSFRTNAAVKHELAFFGTFEHTYFPIVLNTSKARLEWRPTNNGTPRIGLFGRLHRTRPIEPFLAALNVIRNTRPETELHIWGDGDPEAEGITRMIETFHIDSAVTFHGHTADIVKSATDHELDLIWFQSFYGYPAGYAGYDMCLAGFPHVFWELLPNIDGQSGDPAYNCYRDLQGFADMSLKLLKDTDYAARLSEQQIHAVKRDQDVHIWIKAFEDLLKRTATIE
jgi:glycosyltransferase involved in cell wall biosynthesis